MKDKKFNGQYIALSLGKDDNLKLTQNILSETKIPYQQIVENEDGDYCILFRLNEQIESNEALHFLNTSLSMIFNAYGLKNKIIKYCDKKVRNIKVCIGPALTMDRLCLSL